MQPTIAVPFVFSQVLFGMKIAAWNANNGNAAYINAVLALLQGISIAPPPQTASPPGVSVSAVGLSASASRLGIGASRALQTQGSLQVTTTVQIPPGTASLVQGAVLGSTGGVQNTVASMRAANPLWAAITAQPAVAAGSPTLPPTSAPTLTANSANSQAAAATSVQGLPQTTVIAIVVVLVVVVGAVLFVCYQQNMKKDLSPAMALAEHYRRSNSELFAGRRPSSFVRGRHSVEMTTTHNNDDRSLASENPAFGMAIRSILSSRSSMARPSIDRLSARSPGQVWSPASGPRGSITKLHISSKQAKGKA
jgi:hypothetical protein